MMPWFGFYDFSWVEGEPCFGRVQSVGRESILATFVTKSRQKKSETLEHEKKKRREGVDKKTKKGAARERERGRGAGEW